MPTELYLRLETIGKSREGYKVTFQTAWFLEQCGWKLAKKGREYAYLQPPVGMFDVRTIDVKMTAPTDEEILAAAAEMRATADPGVSQQRILHGWPVVYMPAQSFQSIPIDPFTAKQIGPESHMCSEEAVCRIGFVGIWQAEVRWHENGRPVLTKYPQRAIPSPKPGLSAALTSSPYLQGSEFLDEPEFGTYVEGAVESVIVNAYERDQVARQACIFHYGTRCQVCRFDFGERYGEVGKGFIHVHHLIPLSEIRAQYRVDPVDDLRPVCPNCHAMLHRTSPPLKIDELRARLGGTKKLN